MIEIFIKYTTTVLPGITLNIMCNSPTIYAKKCLSQSALVTIVTVDSVEYYVKSLLERIQLPTTSTEVIANAHHSMQLNPFM